MRHRRKNLHTQKSAHKNLHNKKSGHKNLHNKKSEHNNLRTHLRDAFVVDARVRVVQHVGVQRLKVVQRFARALDRAHKVEGVLRAEELGGWEEGK